MKKIAVSLFLSVITAFTVACGGRTSVVTEDIKEVDIYMVNAGYKDAFMDEWIKDFTTLYPDITVTKKGSTSGATEKAVNDLPIGPTSDNSIDLWFVANTINLPDFISRGKTVLSGYDCVVEDLTALYDEKIPGEERTIREKMDDRALKFNEINGKNYTLTWANGPSGLLMNKTLADSKGLTVPKTTDQFIAQAASLKGTHGITPFIWAGNNAPGYWDYLMEQWKAQYDGLAAYDRYWSLTDESGEHSYEPLHNEGILESYYVLQALANKAYSYKDDDGDSQELRHTDAQQLFMRGKALYMPNGDWFETEMAGSETNSEFVMVKVPVISSLARKIKLAGAGASDAAHEAKLIDVVTAIDAGKTLAEVKAQFVDIDANKIDAVWNARHVVYNSGLGHIAFMPAYSNAKTAGKQFLQYVCSDRGIAIFRKYAGADMPFEYTPPADEVRTPFQQSVDAIMKDSESFFPTKYWTPLRYSCSPISDNAGTAWWAFFNNTESPQQLYDKVYNYAKDRWNNWLRQI